MKKKGNVDVFTAVKNAEAHSRAFKGLPDLKNLETAKETIKKLDRLYSKYKKEKDRNGMLHCTLIAEIAENQTMRKGLVGQMNLYREWLDKVKK